MRLFVYNWITRPWFNFVWNLRHPNMQVRFAPVTIAERNNHG